MHAAHIAISAAALRAIDHSRVPEALVEVAVAAVEAEVVVAVEGEDK